MRYYFDINNKYIYFCISSINAFSAIMSDVFLTVNMPLMIYCALYMMRKTVIIHR